MNMKRRVFLVYAHKQNSEQNFKEIRKNVGLLKVLINKNEENIEKISSNNDKVEEIISNIRKNEDLIHENFLVSQSYTEKEQQDYKEYFAELIYYFISEIHSFFLDLFKERNISEYIYQGKKFKLKFFIPEKKKNYIVYKVLKEGQEEPSKYLHINKLSLQDLINILKDLKK